MRHIAAGQISGIERAATVARSRTRSRECRAFVVVSTAVSGWTDPAAATGNRSHPLREFGQRSN